MTAGRVKHSNGKHASEVCGNRPATLGGSRGMDLSRLLLLLLCMAASEVFDIQARPIDFVCDDNARRDMNTVKELELIMGECNGSAHLPSTVTLPCAKTHKASWDRKSMQQKRGDIVTALRTLAEGVRAVRSPASLPECQSSLLERLERSITNYLHILAHLELQGEAEASVAACPGHQTQDLGLVLWNLRCLLTGKLEWLVAEMRSQCHAERTASKL